MPSGKKARGRQNRAKKEATRRRSLWEPTILGSGVNHGAYDASSCEHTLAVLPPLPPAGLVISFMNSLAGEGFFDKATRFTGDDPIGFCFRSLLCFPEILEVESERSLAIDLLLRFLRNVLLRNSVVGGGNDLLSP